MKEFMDKSARRAVHLRSIPGVERAVPHWKRSIKRSIRRVWRQKLNTAVSNIRPNDEVSVDKCNELDFSISNRLSSRDM